MFREREKDFGIKTNKEVGQRTVIKEHKVYLKIILWLEKE